jgi:hypothetical protein
MGVYEVGKTLAPDWFGLCGVLLFSVFTGIHLLVVFLTDFVNLQYLETDLTGERHPPTLENQGVCVWGCTQILTKLLGTRSHNLEMWSSWVGANFITGTTVVRNFSRGRVNADCDPDESCR